MQVSKALVELPTKPHALYRFFDRTDALLYVGITMGLPGRVGQHRKAKPWWAEVQHMTVEWHASREEALEAEVQAIRDEKPLYNVAHNKMVQVASVGAGEGAPLDDEWKLGRVALAEEVVDRAQQLIGDERVRDAARAAQRDLALPDAERVHLLEPHEEVVTALELVEAIAGDTWRFTFVTERLLEGMPSHLRQQCEEEAAADWIKATGEPAPHRLDLLPDIIRHVGYLFREPTANSDRSRVNGEA